MLISHHDITKLKDIHKLKTTGYVKKGTVDKIYFTKKYRLSYKKEVAQKKILDKKNRYSF